MNTTRAKLECHYCDSTFTRYCDLENHRCQQENYRVKCTCGSEILTRSFAKHLQSKKHFQAEKRRRTDRTEQSIVQEPAIIQVNSEEDEQPIHNSKNLDDEPLEIAKTVLSKTKRPCWDFKKVHEICPPSWGTMDTDETDAATLLMWMRKWNIEKGAMQELLQLPMMSSFPFDSVHKLLCFEGELFPYSGLYYVLSDNNNKNSQRFYFTNLIHILGCLLSNPTLVDSMVFNYESSDTISHPNNSQLWKKYSAISSALSHLKGRVYTLLCPVVFVDEYEKNTTRGDKIYAIYFTLGNLPQHILRTTQYKFVLGLVPPDFPIEKAIKYAVVQPLQQLERGIRLPCRPPLPSLNVCGSLFLLCGDHPGQAKIGGQTGPCSEYPSRWSYASKAQLATTSLTKDTPLPPQRNCSADRRSIDEAKDAPNKKTAKKSTRSKGPFFCSFATVEAHLVCR